MGTSAEAILVWGFDLGDESELDSEVYDKIQLSRDEEWSEWEALEKKTGASLIHYCVADYPCWIVGVTDTKVLAFEGSPQEIKSLEVPAGAQESLDAIARALGIEPHSGTWLLAAYWG